ncbi:MAG: peptidoglycan glycosyltransferase [Saprospiraceae bacterium]|nr:MAG: peptidoglycan glycosyltransferase [Saprospiraceae bacterium]
MPIYQNVIRLMWRLLVWGIIAAIFTFILLSFSDLPDTEELENPKSELASEIIAGNGEVLGRLFIENRVPVGFDELSPYIEQALLATEDVRYYQHSGIDFRGLGRVFFKTFLMGDRRSGGASTITQQLAKLLFTEKPGSGVERVIQKLKEWIIAVQLERKYTKEEIIAMYLNKYDFLYDSYGIKAAAETYFAKSQDSLNIQEAAMLVGMLKNSSLYNPKRKMKVAEKRRSVVLDQMRRNGIFDRATYDSLKVLPIDLSNFRRESHTQGLAQYFRSELAQILLHDILSRDDVRKKADGSPYNPYKDGLKIYTTIDPVIQKHAEEALAITMKSLQHRFWKHWEARGKSPWTYTDKETTDAEIRYRNWKLRQMVRESDRYAIMRDRYIGTLEQDLENEVEGLHLNDVAIERMIKGAADNGFFKKLINDKIISSHQASLYRQAMQNKRWNELKKQWLAFQKAVTVQFNKKVKMKVFDYNETFEKDTVMSPLDSLKYLHMFLQIGSLGVDPKTGHVKSWIGGINHKYFSYDHTRSNRQVGSTFKPFIYATAIAQQGISPCLEVTDLQRTIFPDDGNFGLITAWTPRNADGKYSGRTMRLKTALKKSVNSVSVFLMQQLGSVEPVIELLGNMGVDTKKIPKQPSICLGAADMSVYDMTGAYTTFANNGYYSKPIFITRIEDKNGRTIYSQEQEDRQALQEEPNYVMVEMLKYASGSFGLKSEVGGKTGTTNNYVDGWFMAITPSLVVGTWVGGDDRWVRFLTLAEGQGSRMAKPFCKEFLTRVENDPNADYDWKARFVRPGGDLSIGLDCNDYNNRDNSDDEFNDGESPRQDISEDPFGTNVKKDTTKKTNVENEDFDG